MSEKMPALFVGHGSPMNAIETNNPFNQGFADIVKTFAKPKAILCISAHWYSSRLQVMSGENPPMIYDFHGFPDELHQLVYPAKGSQELAETVCELLAPEKVEKNAERGFDHGAWSVLAHLYPQADVPVVQLSLDRTKPAAWHFELAKKLRPLREQGVLILGSGDIVHNLRAISFEHMYQLGAGYDWAFEFQARINQAIEENNVDALIDIDRFGEAAQLAVPTPDHYLPLLYVMAQRAENEPVQLFNDILVGGSISMTSVKVG